MVKKNPPLPNKNNRLLHIEKGLPKDPIITQPSKFLSPKTAAIQTKKEIETMARVSRVLGKFLTKSLIYSIKNPPQESWLVHSLRTMMDQHPVPLKKCDITFEETTEALK